MINEQTWNYILIALIIFVILFFYKNAIVKVVSKIKELVISLIPSVDFIYV